VTDPLIKAVIFDMDGVLVDAAPLHRAAFRAALFNVEGFTIDPATERWLEGRPTRVKLQMLADSGQYTIWHYADLVCEEKQALTMQLAESLRPEPRIVEAVKVAGRHRAVGCYTNSIRASATTFLARAGVFTAMDSIVTNEDVSKPKPDPEGYRLVMDELGVEPNECLILEDSDVGYEAAVMSGAFALKVDFADITPDNLECWLERLESIVAELD